MNRIFHSDSDELLYHLIENIKLVYNGDKEPVIFSSLVAAWQYDSGSLSTMTFSGYPYFPFIQRITVYNSNGLFIPSTFTQYSDSFSIHVEPGSCINGDKYRIDIIHKPIQLITGIKMIGHDANYDGSAYTPITFNGLQGGEVISFSTDGSIWEDISELPPIVYPGSYRYYIKISRQGCIDLFTEIVATIHKRPATIEIANHRVTYDGHHHYGSDYQPIGLIDGHYVSGFDWIGGGINPGTYVISWDPDSIEILDNEFKFWTHCYEFSVLDGVLEIIAK